MTAERLRTLLLSLTMVAAVVAANGCGESAPQLQTGQPAPAFTLVDLQSKAVAFPAHAAGQVVAVRFWADWCPFCESEMTQLEPVYRKYRDQGLRLLAVNVRQDAETARRFVAKLGISYETLLDLDGRVARSYGVLGLPTTFFIGRDGTLKGKVIGESTPEVFERIVADLL